MRHFKKLIEMFVVEDTAQQFATYYIDVDVAPEGFEDIAAEEGFDTAIGFQDARGNSLLRVQGADSAIRALFQRLGVRRYFTPRDSIYRDPESGDHAYNDEPQGN